MAEVEKSTEFLLNLKRVHFKYKKGLLSVLKALFEKPHLESNESRLKIIIYYFGSLFDSLQLSSLVLINQEISGWQRFSSVWMMIHFTRIDFLCAKEGTTDELTILAFSVCLLAPLLFLILLVLVHLKKRYKELASVLRTLIGILNYFHITIALSLTISLKYSILGTSVVEYPLSVRFSFGPVGIILSMLALISLYSVCVCNYKFNYDFRHSLAYKSINSKVSSIIDSYAVIASFATVILYVFFSATSFIIFRVILTLVHSLVLVLFYQRMPYYQFKINFFKALPHIFVVIFSLATIISYLNQTATFSILSLLCLLPISIILYYFLLRYRKASFKSITLASCTYSWQFELLLRDELIDINNFNKQIVCNAFDKYFKLGNRNPTQIQLMWYGEFCLYACNEPLAALIKISLFPKLKSNLEIEFHRYCFNKEIKASALFNKNDYNTIKTLIRLQRIKEQDSTVCILMLKFINIIKNSSKSQDKVELSLRMLTRNLKTMKKIYKRDSSKCSESLLIIEHYRSFADLFLHNYGLLAMLELKKESLLNEIAKKDSRNILENEMRYLLLVSAEDDDFGFIQYISDQLLSLLKINQLFYLGRHVKNLFLGTYSFFHNQQLYDFKFKAFENMTYIEEYLLLKNSQGSVEEMFVSVKLIYYGRMFFVFFCRPVSSLRKLVLIAESGLILEYSQGLPSLLHCDSEIQGCFIQKITKIDLQHLKACKSKTKMQYFNASTKYLLKEFKGITMNIIYFYPENNQNKIIESNLPAARIANNAHSHAQFYDSRDIFNTELLTNVKNVNNEYKHNMKLTKKSVTTKKIQQESSKKEKLIGLFRLVLLFSVFYI